MKSGAKHKSFFLYVYLLISIVILYFSSIPVGVRPCFYAYIFSLLYFDINAIFLLIVYGTVNILFSFSTQTIIFTILISVVILFLRFLHYILKKPISKTAIGVYYIFVQIFLVYKYGGISSIASAVLGFLFLYACINYLSSYFKMGSVVRFTIDKYICGAVYVVALANGLYGINIFGFSLLKFVGTFIILSATFVYSSPVSVIIAILLGIGVALKENFSYIFCFSFISVFAYGFKGYNKIISCLSVLMAEIILGLYFNLYDYYSLVDFAPVFLAVILFCILEKLFIERLKNLYGVNFATYGIKTLVNRNREQICFKMNELSNVFNEMNRLYQGMIRGSMSENDATDVLLENAVKTLCSNCKKKERCFSSECRADTIDVIRLVLKKGFEKGKINILDIPQLLSYRCTNISQFISVVNNLTINYKQYSQMVKNNDLCKMLVAEQLKGVSNLLDLLSMEIGSTILFNNKLEQKIKDELAYYDVICDEVLVYDLNTDNSVSLVINDMSNIDYKVIENIISKIMKRRFLLSSNKIGTYGNVIEYKCSPKFGYMFGASGKGKENISGDTYSFTKINNNKVMFAICDGIGTGENAQNVSEISLNLIENFYKAGYDTQIILSSVNKLLSTDNSENYSALDIVVVDLKTGIANFIKLGAPDGIIRTENGIEVVKSGALPLGILEEVEPMIYEREMNANDMIVLCSDGVIDAFGSAEKVEEFVDYQTTMNPQILADAILNQSFVFNKRRSS